MLRHTVNGYVANKVFRSSLPKIKKDKHAAKTFKKEFDLSSDAMRVVGIIEMLGALFLVLSLFGRKFVRIGTVLLNIVLGGAIIKHFQAGHGYKGAKPALTLFGINLLSFSETFRHRENSK